MHFSNSFTNHLFSGTAANGLHFQAYMLDGIVRWNADREAAAIQGPKTSVRSYSGALRAAVEDLRKRVLDDESSMTQRPGAYTGN